MSYRWEDARELCAGVDRSPRPRAIRLCFEHEVDLAAQVGGGFGRGDDLNGELGWVAEVVVTWRISNVMPRPNRDVRLNPCVFAELAAGGGESTSVAAGASLHKCRLEPVCQFSISRKPGRQDLESPLDELAA